MADLPDDPDLGWLRNRAKELRREHPEWKLSEAQRRLARHYEFASWPALKRYVDLVRSYRRAPDEVGEQRDPTWEFLRLTCLTYSPDDDLGRWERAASMLVADPAIGRDSVWAAAACCDVESLRRLLDADPRLATAQGGPHQWAPLAYLAYARHGVNASNSSGGSGGSGGSQVTEAATLESARLLLEHGADPDTGYLWHGLPSPFTVLTGCFGEGEGGPTDNPPHPHGFALARLLLDAGADPNDAQTLYNQMFEPDNRYLELLFEFGLGTGEGGPWNRRLGRAASTPADMLLGQLAWAVLHGFNARVELLAAQGVELDAVLGDFGGDGRTAYQAALVSGHTDTADLLVRLGATVADLDDGERVVAAVLTGGPVDPDAVASAIVARPGLVAWAANLGDLDAVRRAVELGWAVDRRARTDVPSDQEWETGLHAAAGRGDVAMVGLLLELGADPAIRDSRFDGTPRDWAVHFGHLEIAELMGE